MKENIMSMQFPTTAAAAQAAEVSLERALLAYDLAVDIADRYTQTKDQYGAFSYNGTRIVQVSSEHIPRAGRLRMRVVLAYSGSLLAERSLRVETWTQDGWSIVDHVSAEDVTALFAGFHRDADDTEREDDARRIMSDALIDAMRLFV